MPKKSTKTATKSKKTTKKRKPKYSLSIKVNDDTFKTEKDTLEEALTEFVESDKFPVGVKTTTFIKYEKGKNKGQQLWHVPRARRTFRLISLKKNSRDLLASKWEQHLE